MKFKLFWRYACASVLDTAVFYAVGALIIFGFMGSKNLHLDFNQKFALAGLSALFWVFFYTTYIPFHYFNGQSLMQKAFGVGVEYQGKKIMNYRNLFFLHGLPGIVLPVSTLGIFYVVNWLYAIYFKRHLTLEEYWINVRYYLVSEKTHVNTTKFTAEKTKKIAHKPRKRKNR